MDVIEQLLGRLHPLLVHLPIGFIIAGLLLQWYFRKTKQYSKIIGLIYLWAGFGAVLACITGYLQYLGEGYLFETVKWHLWLGIATALFSFLMFLKYQEKWKIPALKSLPLPIFIISIFILVSFTGHFGGNITHGEDYLTEPLPNSLKKALGIAIYESKPIAISEENWKSAHIYDEVVAPILNNNCLSCHNPKKNKGGLELHDQASILKGGESGKVVIANNADKSELIVRMVLPVHHENHMPPEGKSQPSKEEIELLAAWVNDGFPFDKTLGETGMEKDLFEPFFPQKVDFDHPDINIEPAAKVSILAAEKSGVHVDKISNASNFLRVSCINAPSFTDSDFNLLKPIENQIAILDLGGTKITDSIFAHLARLSNLTVLKVDNTAITGNTIDKLSTLQYLKSINLMATEFETTNLKKLERLKTLRKIYVFGSKVTHDSQEQVKYPYSIDYGNYDLPQIASDSIIY